MQNKTVITFGTFDLFHIGHLNILERARKLGNKLIVGISSDNLNFKKKGFSPIQEQDNRMRIVAAIRYVDEVFLEESLELKKDYILKHKADILVMGNDWEGSFDFCKEVCDVIYLERTKKVSTTDIKEIIRTL
jgi:glycerol-3-phosphate cytidylyltransferase